MTTLKLKDIEKRVAKNSIGNRIGVIKATKKIQSQNLKRGRVRPKDPIETKILSRFYRR